MDTSHSVAASEVEVSTSLDGIASEWDDLARRSGAPPFARPGWIRAWWSAFGQGRLHILTVRQGGELSAVLPLAEGRGRLRSCSNVHTPVFDCVADSDDAVLAALETALREAPLGLMLSRLQPTGRLAAAVRDSSIKDKARLQVLRSIVAPYFESSMNPYEFEHSLGQKKRGKVRRNRRRLADEDGLAFEMASPTAEIEERLQEFFRLEASGWKADAGTAISMSQATKRFYTNITTWAAETGLLRLSFLRVGEQPVAGSIGISAADHLYVLKVGYDSSYSRYGPGVLLAIDEMSRAFVHGQTYEHGGGQNELKNSLNNGFRTIEEVALFPRTFSGFAGAFEIGTRNVVYERARNNEVFRRRRDLARSLFNARRPRQGS